MSAIATADIHLNDHPRDASRWDLLDWLAKQQADELLILGDLTTAKNNHPASVVNRLVDAFLKLSQKYRSIYLLKGNHDYIDPNCPFFRFIEHTQDNITFVWVPTVIPLTIGPRLFMPAGTDWYVNQDLIRNRHVFAHATFDGAISETGYQLTGVNPRIVTGAKAQVVSGDVHKQQILAGGAIEYIGAPYHIHYGDNYDPRLLLIDNNGTRSDLYFPAPKKYHKTIASLADLDRIEIERGDHIKITVQMRRADLPDWKSWRDLIKGHAEKLGWQLLGPELKLQAADIKSPVTGETLRVSNEAMIEEYAIRQKVSKQHIMIGHELLKASKS